MGRRRRDAQRSDRTESAHPNGVHGSVAGSDMPMKTAAWPGLPGSKHPGTRDRSGTKKITQGAKQEGL